MRKMGTFKITNDISENATFVQFMEKVEDVNNK